MPVIHVFGVYKDMPSHKRVDLEGTIARAVLEIPELELAREQISIFLWVPQKHIPEVIIRVEGLFKKPKRTVKVLKALADRIEMAVYEHYNCTRPVECFIYPFDPSWGFASSAERLENLRKSIK